MNLFSLEKSFSHRKSHSTKKIHSIENEIELKGAKEETNRNAIMVSLCGLGRQLDCVYAKD